MPAPMSTCPSGHASADPGFCDVCGRAMDGPAPAAAAPPPARPEPTPPPPVPPVRMPAPTAWTATVSADRAYYDSVMAAEGPDADGITFPPFCPDRHFPLQGKQVSIGRHSRRRGIDPDIDLTGPPADPGISHLHALLVAQDDGSWAIVDLDSANGLSINDEPRPLRPNVPRVLVDGDRVYLGAWTRITLRAT